jgi:hypothetical protein
VTIVAMFGAVLAVAAVLVSGSGDAAPLLIPPEPEDSAPVEAAAPDPRREFAHVRGFLASVPDTKNLVTSARGAVLTHAREITLRHFRGERVVAGAVELRRGDQTVGLFQNWMDLVPIDASTFVLHRAWHGPDVTLVAVSIDELRPLSIPNRTERAAAIGGGEELFALDEATCTEARIPRSLEPGTHEIAFSDCLRVVDEVLIMYPSTRPEHPNRTHVMRVEPRSGRDTVIQPDDRAFWRFDEAHSPIRILRDPRTGRAVGDCLKLGAFVLNEAMTAVEVWL